MSRRIKTDYEAIDVLNALRSEVKAMETQGVIGHEVLISKLEVLENIGEWIEAVLENSALRKNS